MAASDKKSDVELVPVKMVDVVVARGRTVQHNDADGERTFGPGSTASVPESNVKFLRAHGFVLLEDDDVTDVQSTPSVSTDSPGSVIREV